MKRWRDMVNNIDVRLGLVSAWGVLVGQSTNIGDLEGELNLFGKFFIIFLIFPCHNSVVGVDIESLGGSNDTYEGSGKSEHIFY